MSKVKGKNTKPEMIVRKFLFSNGFRYRLHDKKLPGSPDMVLPKYKIAIFVHGCFWHRHDGCSRASTPKTNLEFWNNKFENNLARDNKKELELKSLGWKTIVIWECDLSKSKLEPVLNNLMSMIKTSIV